MLWNTEAVSVRCIHSGVQLVLTAGQEMVVGYKTEVNMLPLVVEVNKNFHKAVVQLDN